jgi:hypothetical protein
VWGPDIFGSRKSRLKPCDNSADKVQLAYLRHMAGCGPSTSIDVLLRDFNRLPLSYRWVVLASRWFVKLQDMDVGRLAYNVWVADIELMLDGCRQCWTYMLLQTLTILEVVPSSAWDPAVNTSISKADVMQICLVEEVVQNSLQRRFSSRWVGLHPNPRLAPQAAHDRCIHATWVLPTFADAHQCQQPSSPHLKLCMSFKMLQCLARFRIGWHYLESHSARMRRRPAVVPWGDRKCRLCAVPSGPYYYGQAAATADDREQQNYVVEDLLHFVLECPAYAHIRARHPAVFCEGHVFDEPGQRMLAIFATHRQADLASCLYSMNRHRRMCLQHPAVGGATSHTRQLPPLPSANDDVELMQLGMID